MKIFGNTVQSYCHLVYQEQASGIPLLIKDRFGGTTMTATEAMATNHRVCVVNRRGKVTEANSALHSFLGSKGLEVSQ